MKKVYSKPEIVFESFSLSQNIAAGCEFISDVKGGGLNFGSFVLFFNDASSPCTGDGRVTSEGGDGQYDKICYHVPQGQNLFDS